MGSFSDKLQKTPGRIRYTTVNLSWIAKLVIRLVPAGGGFTSVINHYTVDSL